MSAKSRLAPNKPVFDSSWSTCFNEAINKLCLSAKKLWKLPANELIQTFCAEGHQKVNITQFTQSLCVCVRVCVRLKGCSCRRLARIKQTQRLSQMQIAKSATNTECEFYLRVYVCAALGQLMETKDATHTHAYKNTLMNTHAHIQQPNANIFDVHWTLHRKLCKPPSRSLSYSLFPSLATRAYVCVCVCVCDSCVTKIIAENCSKQ